MAGYASHHVHEVQSRSVYMQIRPFTTSPRGAKDIAQTVVKREID